MLDNQHQLLWSVYIYIFIIHMLITQETWTLRDLIQLKSSHCTSIICSSVEIVNQNSGIATLLRLFISEGMSASKMVQVNPRKKSSKVFTLVQKVTLPFERFIYDLCCSFSQDSNKCIIQVFMVWQKWERF